MFDILSLMGIPTTTVGVIWMLVRIGVWYWYNHTVGGKEAIKRDVMPQDSYSFSRLIYWPALITITGLVILCMP